MSIIIVHSFVGAAATVVLPNIIFILADDAGFNDFGFTKGVLAPIAEFTGPQALTPQIDVLANSGIILANAYVYRYCSPTRGALLTGRLPFHGHEKNPGIASPGCANLNYTMIPAKLRDAGYRSFHVGKWHEGIQSKECLPVNRGFDHSFGYLSGAEDHVDQTVEANEKGPCADPTLTPYNRSCAEAKRGGGCVDLWRDHGPAHGENGTYNAYAFTQEAERRIAEHAALGTPGGAPPPPLFAYIAFQNVHGPYEVPTKYRNLFPKDVSCDISGGANDCCTWTERHVSSGCDVFSTDANASVCKCPSAAMPFQPAKDSNHPFNCPPGGQCTRNYMLAMLAALDDSVGRVIAALKTSGLYDNTLIVFSSDNGGAVADGKGADAPAPVGKGMGEEGAMNNYPLRGGKASYFEGGVRVASFVHSKLLPAHTRGTILRATIAVVDWWPTFAKLAGLSPEDPPHRGDEVEAAEEDARVGDSVLPAALHPLPQPWGCFEHKKCNFGIDGVDLWGLLSGVNTTHPRTELMLGQLDGGGLISGSLKYITGQQSPDWWYGPHSPNCTSGTGTHPDNCENGCLFDLSVDWTEHVNLRNASGTPGKADFKRLEKRFHELKASLGGPAASAAAAAEVVAVEERDLKTDLCTAMWKNGGFYSPYAVVNVSSR